MTDDIRVGLIRCDTHGAYYGPLMQEHDPMRLQMPLPIDRPARYSWQHGGAHFYFPIDPIGTEFNRRTIYRFSPRGERSTLLDCLDCPDPSGTAPRRSITTTPLQALSLQNNSFIWRMADHFADRLKKEAGAELESQIERAWILAVGRPPAEEEHHAALTLVENHGLAALGRALFNSSEFIVVE